MALPILSVPAFPNVPPFPGVPPLPRDIRSVAGLAAPQITRLVTDATIVQRLLGRSPTPNWGIWDSAGRSPVIIGDSVISTDYQREYQISDYPVEQGQFQSYNRVRRPKEVIITITKGGSVSDRGRFLDSINQAVQTTTLYTAVMPEGIVKNLNLIRWTFCRSQDQGAQLIKVDVHAREVITTATATFSATKDAASSGQQNSGQVAPQTPTTAQASGLNGGAH